MPRTGRPRHDRHRICPKCGKHFEAKDLRTIHCSRSCAYTKHDTMPSKECVACGETFTKRRNDAWLTWERQAHCSRKCAHSERTRLVLTCDHCGTDYNGKLQGLEHSFCSQSCYGLWRQAQCSLDPNASGAFSAGAKRILLERAGHKCQSCSSTDDLEFDHVVPQAAGGLGDVDNGQVLCNPCHWQKTLGERLLIRDLLRAHYGNT